MTLAAQCYAAQCYAAQCYAGEGLGSALFMEPRLDASGHSRATICDIRRLNEP